MSTAIDTSKTTKQTGNGDAIADAAQAKAKEQKALLQREYTELLESDRLNQEKFAKAGSDNRSMLAIACGQSVKSKVGRPEVAPYRRLHAALLGSSQPFKEWARCYALSLGAIGTGEDSKLSAEEVKEARSKHVTGKGKAEEGKGNVTLRMAKPLAIAIAFGD